MKTPPSPKTVPRGVLTSRFEARGGVALILVLGFLLLITALVIAFFSSVTAELSGAKSYASSTTVRQLADSAAQIVMGQIRLATSGNSTVAWASQPGMIRTYDASGNAKAYYKLYSSNNMVETTPGFDPATDYDDQWSSKSALFTDLNSPVITTAGKAVFPIVDGNGIKLLSKDPVGATVTSYLGYDTNGDGLPDIDGFSLDPNKIHYAPGAPFSPTNTPVPMPTKWIYILRDGTLTTPSGVDGAEGKIANWKNANNIPTRENPIIGRIAFWTDDETSKININTASEGLTTYNNNEFPATWDVPRFYTTYDQNVLAKSQAAQKEFQRYPGHPATISLSAVLKAPTAGYTTQQWAEEIFKWAPRIVGGDNSTKGGTQAATNSYQADAQADQDRLYANVDELLFRPSRATNDPTTNKSILNSATLERARFFLTASSRAPDVNLYNMPRICMWPLSANGTSLPYRSPLDQLFAFCTTINNHYFFFQRQDPNDPFTDLPNLPGSSTCLGRNRMLLEYLRNLTSKDIPGFGGNFAQKYHASDTLTGSGITGTEMDQILTEIFDYIRSSNTVDRSMATSGTNPVTPYTIPLSPDSNHNFSAGAGQVIPIVDSSNGTRGFGRFPTLQQAALIFFPSQDNGATPPVARQLQAAFVLQLFDPSMGYPWNYGWYDIQVKGLAGLTWDGTVPMFTAPTATINSPYNGTFQLEPMTGGIIGWTRLVYHNYWANSGSGKGAMFSEPYPANPPVTSTLASLGITGIQFTGGPITVEFHKKNSDGTTGTLLQSINLTFPNAPAGGFPIPDLSINTSYGYGPSWSKNWSVRDTQLATNNSGLGTMLGNLDVVRSVVATGDVRMIAARQTIPDASSFFSKHPKWDSVTRMAHDLRTSTGSAYYGASTVSGKGGGRLVPLAYDGWHNYTYNENNETSGIWWNARDCDISTDTGVFAGGVGSVPGDWDNGIGNMRDGPYINKADEGDNSTSGIPYYYVYGKTSIDETYFSPNRMIPSPGMLGSLPTGVLENKPWQTLLFRPGPQGHYGLTSPADHLLLDLFTMPVVEPYAISEPLSTAGRINMNYQIVPFTYIARQTGLQAVLKSATVISVPDADASLYKQNTNKSATTNTNSYHLRVNIPATLSQFDARFADKEIFRSPSEICSVDLVPSDYTGSLANPGSLAWRNNLDAYWSKHRLTGDNSRERPYANIYPLLTTKSNTYTIHFRVQSLQKVKGGDAATWDGTKDKILGEYRGSQTIERFIDPSDPNLPDYANPSITTPLSDFYRFRVIQTKQFAR